MLNQDFTTDFIIKISNFATRKKQKTMETITFKPYTFLTLSESEDGNVYRIVKYNLIKKDWEILSGIYTDKAEVLIKIADLNQEAGLVTVAIEG